jgi:outer membrane protein assembly factor BamA
MHKLLTLIICLGQLTFPANGQEDSLRHKKTFQQEDIKYWFTRIGIRKEKPEKNNFLLIIPVVASNPTAGFIFGGGLTYAYKTTGTDRHMSTISSNATYSTKKLLNLNVKSNVFVMNEQLVLNGDWRYLINSETTYGLGTNRYISSNVDINGYETSTDSLGQALQFNQIRIHETGSWKLFPNFFAGIGIHYDHYYNINDNELTSGDTASSFQYQYSLAHGFNPRRYTMSGFSLNLLFDSRDNQVNAYKGYFVNVNYRVNLTGLGSSQNSTSLLTEYRSFHSLDGGKNRHVLGFWIYGSFVTSGNVPYLLLPALGYDQRQRTGRGYTFGRFRGENMLYGETEYRFPISPYTGILGGVLFFNTTTTTDKKNNVQLLEYLREGYGAGMRITLDKNSRTRLEVDAGIAGKTVGFYLGAQETF